MIKITMTKENYKKVNGKWKLEKETTEQITQEFYNNIVDFPIKGDRRYKAYTKAGYIVNKVVSIEPVFKENRTVRRFKFEN